MSSTFGLFLNDLQENLFEVGAKGVNLWDINICTLLYADELVLIADNKTDLKLQMNSLAIFPDRY